MQGEQNENDANEHTESNASHWNAHAVNSAISSSKMNFQTKNAEKKPIYNILVGGHNSAVQCVEYLRMDENGQSK